MIQISFEPAFDPYHTAFRFLTVAAFSRAPMSLRRARLLDLFFLEPFRAKDIRVPPKLKPNARNAATCQRPLYGKRPSSQSLFNRMRPIQDGALQTLVLKGFFAPEEFKQDILKLEFERLSDEVEAAVSAEIERATPLLNFLIEDLSQFRFEGVGGIKDRTKLGEFKYDVV